MSVGVYLKWHVLTHGQLLVNLTPADLPPLPPPPRPDPATSPHPNVPHTLAESTDKHFNPPYTHDVLQRIWQTRRNGRLWGRSRLRKLRVVQRPSATIRGPSIFFSPSPYVFTDSSASQHPAAAPPPPHQSEAYEPLPSVIEKNAMCDFALQAAPNVLFGRYKQYGQVRCCYLF